jgi:hypothetical protein
MRSNINDYLCILHQLAPQFHAHGLEGLVFQDVLGSGAIMPVEHFEGGAIKQVNVIDAWGNVIVH